MCASLELNQVETPLDHEEKLPVSLDQWISTWPLVPAVLTKVTFLFTGGAGGGGGGGLLWCAELDEGGRVGAAGSDPLSVEVAAVVVL